jgi:4-hydroxybenzoate polyprenyltransferase
VELVAQQNMSALTQLLVSSRPVSWINTAFPFAAAYWLITGQLDTTVVVGALFFLVPYNLLMYGINDVFDYPSDLLNPRKGGIEGALLHPKYHRLTILAATLATLPFIGFLIAVGNPLSSTILLVTLFTVVAYSAPKLRFKERPLLDSVTSASHFLGPLLFGIALAGVNPFTAELLPLVLAFALWGVASHAFGAVQDIRADRAAGIGSVATVVGARATVRLAFIFYALAALLLALAPWPVVLKLAAMAAVPYILIMLPYLNLSDENCELANRGWKRFIWLNFSAGAIISLLIIEWLDQLGRWPF